METAIVPPIYDPALPHVHRTCVTERAYELVRDAGPLSTNALNDQTFMAGWIALRFLNDAKTADKHFADFVRSADGPLSRGKANYWVGRTAEKLGDREKAQASYRAAAVERDTFHGLLAMQKLAPGRAPLKIEPPAEPRPEQVAKLTSLDAAKAFALARKAGLEPSVTRVFLLNLAKLEKDEAWSAMSAHLARATGDTQTAVRIGKVAIARGQNLIFYSYPVLALRPYTPLRSPPETAMLLGLARQETEFNSDTVSGAGARGILQVMKVTANHVCRDYKIKCNHQRLLTDSSYNTMIASYHRRPHGRMVGSTYWPCRATTPGRAARSNGLPSSAIRAVPASIRSTGSSASRSRRRGATSPRFYRTSRSIVRGSGRRRHCGSTRI
jgi:soluble lytic murein transglycosylase